MNPAAFEGIDEAARRRDLIRKANLTMKCIFVSQSISRNAKNKNPSLNWVCNLYKGDRMIIASDYMQGIGHAPIERPGNGSRGRTIYQEEEQRGFAEHGKFEHRRVKEPKLEDVLHCLLSDADVLNYTSFEDWAPNLGYDPDSRSAEKTWLACMDTALKLRNGLGEPLFTELQEAFHGY